MKLAGLSEIAEILGVSKQRIVQLRQQPGFPAPIDELKMGAVWLAEDIENFSVMRNKRSGRPVVGRAGVNNVNPYTNTLPPETSEYDYNND